jgi:hypothetical protein
MFRTRIGGWIDYAGKSPYYIDLVAMRLIMSTAGRAPYLTVSTTFTGIMIIRDPTKLTQRSRYQLMGTFYARDADAHWACVVTTPSGGGIYIDLGLALDPQDNYISVVAPVFNDDHHVLLKLIWLKDEPWPFWTADRAPIDACISSVRVKYLYPEVDEPVPDEAGPPDARPPAARPADGVQVVDTQPNDEEHHKRGHADKQHSPPDSGDEPPAPPDESGQSASSSEASGSGTSEGSDRSDSPGDTGDESDPGYPSSFVDIPPDRDQNEAIGVLRGGLKGFEELIHARAYDFRYIWPLGRETTTMQLPAAVMRTPRDHVAAWLCTVTWLRRNPRVDPLILTSGLSHIISNFGRFAIARSPMVTCDHLDRPGLMYLWDGVAIGLAVEGEDAASVASLTLVMRRSLPVPLAITPVNMPDVKFRDPTVTPGWFAATIEVHPAVLIMLPLRVMLLAMVQRFVLSQHARNGTTFDDPNDWVNECLW